MNDNSSQPTFETISNIRLTRMPDRPQPRDKLYRSGGVVFRLSKRFVYKPRLHAGSAWKLYDGVTVPRKEDLILVGNPNKKTSRLVYTLADQADYRMLDICEIPFVTLATTRNILNAPPRMDFGQQSNDFPFTFRATPRSQTQPDQTQPVISTPSVIVPSCQPKLQSQIPSVSPVAACIAAVASYFDFTSPSGPTAQKRSRENAFEEDQEEANRRQRRRFGSPYSNWMSRYSRIQVLITA